MENFLESYNADIDSTEKSQVSPILTTKKLTPTLFHQPSQRSNGSNGKNRRPFTSPFPEPPRKRIIFKNGTCNVTQHKIAGRHKLKFVQDLFSTLVDAKWRWTLLVFAISFSVSFLGFAMIWWIISISHGDLEPDHMPPLQKKNSWTPCVTEIYNFTSSFLFSVETQITTGYGGRAITEECLDAIIVMCLQSVVGMMIQALMIGIVYAKLTRPKQRAQTLLFSRNAVVCQRDDQLCFIFRIGDMRKSHIIDANVRAQVVACRRTKEGEVLNRFHTELELSSDNVQGNLFFIWPMTIVHVIDENSPFYYLSAGDMLRGNFEVLVSLEGTTENTGQATQARTSYLANEILWGHVFQPIVHYNKERGGYEANYSKFDETRPVDTPLCSAAELYQYRTLQKS
ncbi:ATP-sensitive inward rectifier potassium channel 11-like [Harmonia axyridis]|uniref:ATP-sensitive inward rectifier potassium channel 11-like n=1 Tax=Harmonia axyridis TaxID=115357 RepID=UPI001E276637|nr:ATP-sensitive inward rectifier potassium channel 11-like [Harmonia axyridis]